MEIYDDDLKNFEAEGAAPLPVTNDCGYVENNGARIWYASYGFGSPVILLHGGLGHSGNWGYQVPALIKNGYRAVLIDSRGHGRSTRDSRPFSYELMASDVLTVMLRSTCEGLRPAIGYAGKLQWLRRRRQPHATDATQLLRTRSRENRRACRDRAERA